MTPPLAPPTSRPARARGATVFALTRLGLAAAAILAAAPLPAQSAPATATNLPLTGTVNGAVGGTAAASSALAQRITAIVTRPEFRHASFGIEIYSLDSNRVVYSLNGDKLFVPASTTKLVTLGTSLQLLGADRRFHTRIYRTGPVSRDGTLTGDLVLVGRGDANLSGRLKADGTLAFENEDHAYDGSPNTMAVAGDPLRVIRELAAQVRSHGIRRVRGRVLVDATLFHEGERELGTGTVISPIVVNDNLVDVTLTPGAQAGDSVAMRVSPATSYVRLVNRATTTSADSEPVIRWSSDDTNPDGSHTVTVTGHMPAGKSSILYSYAVPSPSRFAQVTLVEALRADGVKATLPPLSIHPDFKGLAAKYTDANAVAEHVSAPFSEDVKVTLKVSQNLHASLMPYVLGALLGGKGTPQVGFDLEHGVLEKAGLDLSGASQADGAGGSAHFTPDFMVHYLAWMAKQPSFPVFFAALPVLGRDGTLWNVQVTSPAAGQVHAKTGTYTREDLLNHGILVDGKGLAGYLTTVDGRKLAFAIYANNVPVARAPDAITTVVGQALGEIAAAAYDAHP